MKAHQDRLRNGILALCEEMNDMALTSPAENCALLRRRLDEIAKLAVSVEILSSHLHASLEHDA